MDIKKKCVIFDMDGCLVDTERAYINAWEKAFRTEKIPMDRQEIENWAGKGYETINGIVEDYTKSKEKMLKIRNLRVKYFWETVEGGKISLMPGAMEILDFVKNEGLTLGIATSTSTENALKILDFFGITSLFDFKVFGDMIENVKPAPDIYIKAVYLSGRAAGECIAFEDSAYGVSAANAAGVDVVYVPDMGMRAFEDSRIYSEIDNLSKGIEILRGII